MRTLITGIAILGAALVAASTAHADSTLETVAREMLAQKYGFNTRDILSLERQSKEDVYELAPVVSAAHYCHASPNKVWALRQQGMGWGEVAHELNMHPGTFNKLRVAGAFDRDRIWSNSFRSRYGARSYDIDNLRKQGCSWEDVHGTVVISKASGKNFGEVYSRRRSSGSWSATAKHYQVDLARRGRTHVSGEVHKPNQRGKGSGKSSTDSGNQRKTETEHQRGRKGGGGGN